MTDQEKLGSLEDEGTAAAILMDRLLRHQHYVQRVGGGEAAIVLAFLRDSVLPEVRALLAREIPRLKAGDFSGAQRVIEMRRLEREVGAMLGEGMETVFGQQSGRMVVFGQAEWQAIAEAIEQSIPSALRFAVEVGIPPAETLARMIRVEPIVGQIAERWWKDLGEKATAEIVRQVNIGLASGESLEQITARVLPLVGSPTAGSAVTAKMLRDAESLARTIVTGISGSAAQSVFDENRDVLKGEQWVATLDNITCPRCWPYDGRVFAIGEGVRPPLHPSCRCVMVPVIRSWRELGIDIDDTTPSTRASMDGQVPETWSYGEWFRRQPAAFQREVLGPARYDIYRRGDLPIERFTDIGTGRPLRVEELLALERSIEAGISPRYVRALGELAGA